MSGCPRCGTNTLTGRLGVCANCLLGEGGHAGKAGPDEIGGLELLDELGRGGMGTVYRARDKKLGRIVAVKFLPDELADDADLKARFLREARAMAALDHRGIVAIHDLREEDGQTFLVMELVDGQPLSKAIPLPPDRALDVMVQVCDALAYAHARGVVHRDVKPENVLLDREGRAKVADFGIARILEDRSAATRTGMILGTPQYMAPEAMTGAPADPRMDVFSCGVLLYQLLTGKLPVGGLDPMPAPIEHIVKRALEHDPAKRYRDAGEMRADVLAATRAGFAIAALELPDDERMWIRAVALVGTAALGVTLWAGLVSITPRVIDPGDVGPLTSFCLETLPDGRCVSRARFEPGPILGAVFALGVSFGAWAALRRHWRTTGLHTMTPERALPESRRVMWVALAALATYALRKGMEVTGTPWAPVYIPIVGGILLIGVLHLFLETMLESQRTGRPMRREPLALGGMALALLPPVIEMIRFLDAWKPILK